MNVQLVCLCPVENEYIHMPLSGGKNALDLVVELHERLNTQFTAEICFISLFNSNRITQARAVELLPEVFSKHSITAIEYSQLGMFVNTLISRTCDHYAIVWADTLFHSPKLHTRMYKRHSQNRVHYSHSMGYPSKTAPEYISREGLELMHLLINENGTINSISHNSLFKTLQQKINDFDIEVILSETDMRYHRLDLSLDTRRGFVFSKTLYNDGVRDLDEIDRYIGKNPSALMSAPSYVQLQVNRAVESGNYLHPFAYDEDLEMAAHDFEFICKSLHAYSDDMVLQLGFRGELGKHSHCFKLIEIAQRFFKQIYIDTNGYDWDIDSAGWNQVDHSKLIWIVEMDSYSESMYTKIHGDNFSRCHQFISFLENRAPKENLYVQANRLKENEHELGEFLEYWEKRNIKAIIKKYNSYSGHLAQRDSASVRPHLRLPCHHLSRDMHILVDGTVIQCGQELDEKNSLGSIFDDDIDSLYRKNTARLLEHAQNKYHTICENCDEYYTINV